MYIHWYIEPNGNLKPTFLLKESLPKYIFYKVQRPLQKEKNVKTT